MNRFIMIRIILLMLGMIFIVFLLKLRRVVYLEKRIARYSLESLHEENISFFDYLCLKYHSFVNKLNQNKTLNHYSKSYSKYQKDFRVEPIYFIINKLITAILFTFLIIISSAIQGTNVNFIVFVICFVIGYYLYDVYLIFYKKNKKRQIKNSLLRAVIIMNNAFKAGKSTMQAVEIAAKDLPYPIKEEFEKIHQDITFGLSTDIAFNRFAKRVDLEEANYIASSLTILNQTGGNIVMVFSSIERTLFDKKKLESDLKNATAASNLVVKVLMIIPIIFTLLIYVVSPDYFSPLVSTPLGYMILLIILFMFIIYIYLLNKITKVRV